MMSHRLFLSFAAFVTISSPVVFAADAPSVTGGLIPVMTLQKDATNGVTVSKDERVFFVSTLPRRENGLSVGEYLDASEVPYPNKEWNTWKKGDDAKTKFVHVNAIRLGPEGDLWIVDAGAPDFGGEIVTGGPKLVRINIANNEVAKVYDLTAGTKSKSFVDDVRFEKDTAYLTDAGEGALILLDMKSGKMRRVLENDASTTAHRDLTANGKPLLDPKQKTIRLQADQIEISPDGKWLYYQPPEGPLYRVATEDLQNEKISKAKLHDKVEKWYDTPSTGGTAMDADGNLYVTDVDKDSILKITPDKKVTTLITDERLQWPDALWITDKGELWIPVAQLNRMAGLNGGVDAIQFPTSVYKIKIDGKPLRR